MKKTNLLDLMQRYVTGQVTEKEKAKIEAWLDIKKTDEGADLVLSPEDEERLFRKITSDIADEEEIRAFRPSGKGRRLFSNRWLQVAATLIILAMASYTVWFFAGRTSSQTFSAAGLEKAILDDGSIVWLQNESHLTYNNYGDARRATFTGEALFEVAKDPEKPFTISCGALKVEVVGTSFHLKSMADFFELNVLTGKVRLSADSSKEVTIVNASEMVVYNQAGNIIKKPIDRNQVAAIIAPTEYNMEFHNTAMEDVLSRIETKFDVTIEVTDAEVKKCRITADFTDNSLTSTMDMLTELLEISYSIEGNDVNIFGKGCQ